MKFKITVTQKAVENYTVEVEAENKETIDWDYVYNEAPYLPGFEIDDTEEPEIVVIGEDKKPSLYTKSKSTLTGIDFYLDTKAHVYLTAEDISKAFNLYEGLVDNFLEYLGGADDVFSENKSVVEVFSPEKILKLTDMYRPSLNLRHSSDILNYIISEPREKSEVTISREEYNDLLRRVEKLETMSHYHP